MQQLFGGREQQLPNVVCPIYYTKLPPLRERRIEKGSKILLRFTVKIDLEINDFSKVAGLIVSFQMASCFSFIHAD